MQACAHASWAKGNHPGSHNLHGTPGTSRMHATCNGEIKRAHHRPPVTGPSGTPGTASPELMTRSMRSWHCAFCAQQSSDDIDKTQTVQNLHDPACIYVCPTCAFMTSMSVALKQSGKQASMLESTWGCASPLRCISTLATACARALPILTATGKNCQTAARHKNTCVQQAADTSGWCT